jgi:hypothetical protein
MRGAGFVFYEENPHASDTMPRLAFMLASSAADYTVLRGFAPCLHS